MSSTQNTARKAKLLTQLKEIELELKTIQRQFVEVKKSVRTSVSIAHKRLGEKKISELRRQIGLE